jgi:hypothetical protein
MKVVTQAAQESFPTELVNVLSNNTMIEMKSNLARIASWYSNWLSENVEEKDAETQTAGQSRKKSKTAPC